MWVPKALRRKSTGELKPIDFFEYTAEKARTPVVRDLFLRFPYDPRSKQHVDFKAFERFMLMLVRNSVLCPYGFALLHLVGFEREHMFTLHMVKPEYWLEAIAGSYGLITGARVGTLRPS